MKRMGQILIGLVANRVNPLIVCLGKVGNRNYYICHHHDHGLMKEALHVYKLKKRCKTALGWRFAGHVQNLIGTEYEEGARIAAKGFVTEFGGEMKGLSEDLDREVESLKKVASSEPFKIVAPEDLISRSTAREILHRAAAEALGGEQADRIHYRKVLAEWSWPQSWLFPKTNTQTYSRSQIELYGYVHWKVEDPKSSECLDYLTISRYQSIRGGEKITKSRF